MALITAAQARDMSASGALSSASDTLLDTLISRADALMAGYCGYPRASVGAAPTLESAAYVLRTGEHGGVYVDPDNARLLHLSPWPVTTITYIREDDLEVFGAASTVDSGDYEQRGEWGQIVRIKPSGAHGSWDDTPGVIQVSITAGYSTIREDLRAAAAELTLHLYSLRARRGMQSINQQGLQTNYRAEGIPPLVKSILRTGGYVLPVGYV